MSVDTLFSSVNSTLYEKGFHEKEEELAEKQLSQLNETVNDYIIGNGTNVNVMMNGISEQQANGQLKDFERYVDSASQNQVIKNNVGHKIRRPVNNAVSTDKNRRYDGISTAINKMVILRFEMAVRSITGSSGYGSNSEVQNHDRRDSFGIASNTSFISASSRLDLNTNQDRNDETRNEKNFEDGDLPALRPNFDQRAQSRHKCFKIIGRETTLEKSRNFVVILKILNLILEKKQSNHKSQLFIS